MGFKLPRPRRSWDSQILSRKKPPLVIRAQCDECEYVIVALALTEATLYRDEHLKWTGHKFSRYSRYSGGIKIGEYLWDHDYKGE